MLQTLLAIIVGMLNKTRLQNVLQAQCKEIIVLESINNITPLDHCDIPDDWFDTDWKSRVSITAQPGEVIGTHTNFPLLLNDIIPELVGNVQSAGEDIRFVLPNLTELAFEKQSLNVATGQLIYWINLPTIEANTRIYLYFNNPGAADDEDVAGTWNSNYKAIFHMSQTPTLSTTSMTDSSGNPDAEPFGGISQAPGQIGNGLLLNGTTGYLEAANRFLGGNTIMLSAWVKPTTTWNKNMWIIGKNPVNNMWQTFFEETDRFKIRGDLSAPESTAELGVTTNGLDTTTPHYFVASLSADVAQLYIDGVLVASQSDTKSLDDTSATIEMGSFLTNSPPTRNYYLDGILDEVRMSNVLRNTNWITTEFNNQKFPSKFYKIGLVRTIL